MTSTLPANDRVTFEVIAAAEDTIEQKLSCDVIHFYGEIRSGVESHLRDVVEALARREGKRDAIAVSLGV